MEEEFTSADCFDLEGKFSTAYQTLDLNLVDNLTTVKSTICFKINCCDLEKMLVIFPFLKLGTSF